MLDCTITSVSNQLTSESCYLTFYRNQQSMGNRYLEVFEGKRSEYYAAVASVSFLFLFGFEQF